MSQVYCVLGQEYLVSVCEAAESNERVDADDQQAGLDDREQRIGSLGPGCSCISVWERREDRFDAERDCGRSDDPGGLCGGAA